MIKVYRSQNSKFNIVSPATFSIEKLNSIEKLKGEFCKKTGVMNHCQVSWPEYPLFSYGVLALCSGKLFPMCLPMKQ